jgi:anti-anti-sigma regulatory factor
MTLSVSEIQLEATVTPGDTGCTVALSGALVSESLQVMEATIQVLRSDPCTAVTFDLCNLTRSDDAGQRALVGLWQSLSRKGVDVVLRAGESPVAAQIMKAMVTRGATLGGRTARPSTRT